MGYFKLILLFISISVTGQNYYYTAGKESAPPVALVDIFNTGNAASDGAGEANATTGWSAGSTTISSDATEHYDGSYSIKIQVSSVVYGARGHINIGGVNISKQYVLSFWAKVLAPNAEFRMTAANIDEGSDITFLMPENSEWVYYSTVVNPNITMIQPRFTVVNNVTGASTDDIVYLDKIMLTTPVE